jgi:hypothetical protein
MVVLFAFMAFATYAQVQINGVVKDGQGQTVIGATVQEKGTQNGTVTDFDGQFFLNVSSSNAVLVV